MTKTAEQGDLDRAIFFAARDGDVARMARLHEQGFSWGVGVCDVAAQMGHLSCLRYAHINGCPWDAAVCLAAAKGGRLACLEYARVHGCPWGDVHSCLAASPEGSDVRAWIRRQMDFAAVAQAMFDSV